ncbi:pleckstrin homology domain-containing family A member 5 isoform X17 [Apodemus sylvaticus]|uniref:pleckstrin homology domain-containing family A member 5 isoform X17 n=1 Tax=Apodemus sylvaticus TaxID=10129 RepID=UPI002243F945|nr:pleckstrin homology domain-containing family A member 5 isoform X17 [Apodemus sylvaticus]
MAADLNLEWICSLPRSWTYGITRGGRVFFINEEAKSTTWLHPVTGEAVVTGHRRQSTDLPTGWEEAYTFEGARYYIKYTCKTRVGDIVHFPKCFIINYGKKKEFFKFLNSGTYIILNFEISVTNVLLFRPAGWLGG